MGTILHKTLIITGSQSVIEKEIVPIILNKNLSQSLDMGVSDGEMFLNTPGILFIPSSGSKEGWSISHAFNDLNKKIIKKAHTCGLNYCYVRLGGDDGIFDIRQGSAYFELEKNKKNPEFVENLFNVQMDDFEEDEILNSYLKNKTTKPPVIERKSFEENGWSQDTLESWLMELPEGAKNKRLYFVSAGISELSVDSKIDEIPSNWLELEKMLTFIAKNTKTQATFMFTPSIVNGYKSALFSIDYPSIENIKKFNHESHDVNITNDKRASAVRKSKSSSVGFVSSLMNMDNSVQSINCALKKAGVASFVSKSECSPSVRDKEMSGNNEEYEGNSKEEKEFSIFKALLLISILKNSRCPITAYEMQDDWLLLEQNENGVMSIVCKSPYEMEQSQILQEKLKVFIEEQMIDLVAAKGVQVVKKNRL